MAIALWTVLGQHGLWKWLIILSFSAVTVGASMGLIFKFMTLDNSPWLARDDWWWLAELQFWWIPWLCLSTGFLVATLWIFRETGPRLVGTRARIVSWRN